MRTIFTDWTLSKWKNQKFKLFGEGGFFWKDALSLVWITKLSLRCVDSYICCNSSIHVSCFNLTDRVTIWFPSENIFSFKKNILQLTKNVHLSLKLSPIFSFSLKISPLSYKSYCSVSSKYFPFHQEFFFPLYPVNNQQHSQMATTNMWW